MVSTEQLLPRRSVRAKSLTSSGRLLELVDATVSGKGVDAGWMRIESAGRTGFSETRDGCDGDGDGDGDDDG